MAMASFLLPGWHSTRQLVFFSPKANHAAAFSTHSRPPLRLRCKPVCEAPDSARRVWQPPPAWKAWSMRKTAVDILYICEKVICICIALHCARWAGRPQSLWVGPVAYLAATSFLNTKKMIDAGYALKEFKASSADNRALAAEMRAIAAENRALLFKVDERMKKLDAVEEKGIRSHVVGVVEEKVQLNIQIDSKTGNQASSCTSSNIQEILLIIKGSGVSKEVIKISGDDIGAIQRLEAVGFDPLVILKTYFACDRDIVLAEKILMERRSS